MSYLPLVFLLLPFQVVTIMWRKVKTIEHPARIEHTNNWSSETILITITTRRRAPIISGCR